MATLGRLAGKYRFIAGCTDTRAERIKDFQDTIKKGDIEFDSCVDLAIDARSLAVHCYCEAFLAAHVGEHWQGWFFSGFEIDQVKILAQTTRTDSASPIFRLAYRAAQDDLLLSIAAGNFKVAKSILSYIQALESETRGFRANATDCLGRFLLHQVDLNSPAPSRVLRPYAKIAKHWTTDASELSKHLKTLSERRLKAVSANNSVLAQHDGTPLEYWAVNATRAKVGLPEIEVEHPLVDLWGGRPQRRKAKPIETLVDVDAAKKLIRAVAKTL